MEKQQFCDILNMAVTEKDHITLREFLNQAPALSTEPVTEKEMDSPLKQFLIIVRDEPHNTPLFLPPAMMTAPKSSIQPVKEPRTKKEDSSTEPGNKPGNREEAAGPHPGISVETETANRDFPVSISDKDAVRLAYAQYIENAASFLRSGLSVLVVCDKLVVEHLWQAMTQKAHLEPQVLTVPVEEEGGLMPRGLRQRQLAKLKEIILNLKFGQVLVIPHLDLLAGGNNSSLPTESRELIELVYENSDRLVLAFADPSMTLPEVLAARFAVRLGISGVDRTVKYPNGMEKPLGKALVTASEAAHFHDYDPEGLYKNVAGLNPTRLRHAITYAVKEVAGEKTVPVNRLYQAIRVFKTKTSANFEVPEVTFEHIGGYDHVKAELTKAINLMTGSYNLPSDKLRTELIPRGFIFHGPPGTGKTLFAKAVANMLDATIQVVSGPEVTDMYVGESERKVRELFAEARRNAPSVLVFDEFDSIAGKRSGREDGGTRAGNALVAQILTEMDGFRPDVPMLVIGTTNRLDIIDPALLRPSRFKAIAISLPDQIARRAIAEVHAKHFKIDVSPELLEVIAAATDGMNGDEIRSLFRDACVGKYCDVPPQQPDAHLFGRLVGALRRAAEQRTTGTSAVLIASVQPGRHSDRPGPSGPMVNLI